MVSRVGRLRSWRICSARFARSPPAVGRNRCHVNDSRWFSTRWTASGPKCTRKSGPFRHGSSARFCCCCSRSIQSPTQPPPPPEPVTIKLSSLYTEHNTKHTTMMPSTKHRFLVIHTILFYLLVVAVIQSLIFCPQKHRKRENEKGFPHYSTE